MRGSEDQLVEEVVVVPQASPLAPETAPAPQHGACAASASRMGNSAYASFARRVTSHAVRPRRPAAALARAKAPVERAPVRRADDAVASQLAQVATDRRVSRYKTTAGAMAGETAEAQKDASAELAKSQSPVLSVSNVRDIGQAKRAKGEIAAFEPNLLQGITDGTVEKSALDQNRNVCGILDAFLVAGDEQSASLSAFQGQFRIAQVDYARLQTAIKVQLQAIGWDAKGEKAKDVAQGQMEGQTGKSKEELAGEFRKASTEQGSTVATHMAAAEAIKRSMATAAADLPGLLEGMSGAKSGILAKSAALAAVVAAQKADALGAEKAGLEAKVKEVEGYVDKAWTVGVAAAGAVTGGYAGAMAGGSSQLDAAGAAAKAAWGKGKDKALESGKDAAVDGAKDVVKDLVVSAVLGDIKSKIASLSTAISAVKDEEARAKLLAAQAELAAAESAFAKAVQQYANKAAEMQQLKLDYRKKMSEMGAAADKATGGADGEKFEVLAKLLGESDTFLAQVGATISLAEREDKAGAAATEAASKVQRPKATGGQEGQPYFAPYQRLIPGKFTLSYGAVQKTLYLHLGTDSGYGSAEGGPTNPNGGTEAINPVLKVAIGVLKGYETDVRAYAEELRGAFSTEAQ